MCDNTCTYCEHWEIENEDSEDGLKPCNHCDLDEYIQSEDPYCGLKTSADFSCKLFEKRE